VGILSADQLTPLLDRENLMIVSQLAGSLLTIIDDILDISKSESHKLLIACICADPVT
jgi:osomolarity two-component system sensor histidine kinase NIK1